MIVYDSKSWTSFYKVLFKTFKDNNNLRQLMFVVFLSLVYVSTVTYIDIEIWKKSFSIDTVFFSLLGVTLSLFLVFRLNSAYDRWWEGRKLWGKLVNDSRSLAMHLNTVIPQEDSKRRRFFVKSLANFCLALQWHLRDDMRHGELIHINKSTTEDIEKANHVPNAIAAQLFQEIEEMWKEKTITDLDKFQIKAILQSFVDILGACERIKNTPIPFSHSTFIKIFTVVYILVLPFGLITMFHYLTIPAVIVMSFAMFGVEIISDEIENPFRMEANSLPIGRLSDIIRENVYDILKVKSTFKKVEKATEAEVQH